MHEVADMIPYEENPVSRVRRGGETLRRRLDGADAQLDFGVLHDLKARGATEYFALPVGERLRPVLHGDLCHRPAGRFFRRRNCAVDSP